MKPCLSIIEQKAAWGQQNITQAERSPRARQHIGLLSGRILSMTTATEGLIWDLLCVVYMDLQAKQEGKNTCVCIHKLRGKTHQLQWVEEKKKTV